MHIPFKGVQTRVRRVGIKLQRQGGRGNATLSSFLSSHSTSSSLPIPLSFRPFLPIQCVCVTGHIKDPVPFVEKSKALCPGGRFPPSFIHQVIVITGLNKLYDYYLAVKMV